MALEANVFAMRCSRKYGRKQYGKTIGIDKKLVTEVQSDLGPEWVYVLTHRPYSYSGLSVSELRERWVADLTTVRHRVLLPIATDE